MPTAAIDDHLLTTKQACTKLGVGRTTLYEREKAGLIVAVRKGRSIRWLASEVLRHGSDPTAKAPVAASPPVAETFYDRRLAELMTQYRVAERDEAGKARMMNMVHEEMEYREKFGVDAPAERIR
jgi:excisionase family DNA binding protein